MAAKTVWWKDGDSTHVVPNKPTKAKALVLCPECGQAYEGHGKVAKVLVHPGDEIIVHDGGDIEVVRPDPFADVK